MRLKDKVIVVTGGSGLIGSAFVQAIANEGGIPIIADILENAGANYYKTDITNKESICNLIDNLQKKHGRIDALVNNAYPRNKNYGRHFFDVEYEDFCENLSLNLGGYFLTMQQFSKFFVAQGSGNIINIASIYGVVAPHFDIYDGTKMTTPVEYAAIKSGLIHLTRYLTSYLKGKNVRVNTLTPGGIKDKQPTSFLEKYKEHCSNKGMLDPVDLCGALIFLLSDESKFVNGQNIIVDDGFTL